MIFQLAPERLDYPIDFDQDDQPDFTFQFMGDDLTIRAHLGSYSPNEIVCPGYTDVMVFEEGDQIGGSTQNWWASNDDFDPWGFFNYNRLAYAFFGFGDFPTTNGNFVGADHKFIGVRFKGRNDEWHYGYVEISSDIELAPRSITLHGVGYNSTSGESVVAAINGGNPNSINEPEVFLNEGSLVIYPNPATNRTDVRFSLTEQAEVKIEILSLLGEQLQVKNIRQLAAGTHRVAIDLSSLNIGVYFISISNGEKSETRKLVVR